MKQSAEEKHQYGMGHRLDMLQWTAAVIILAISLCFYFIYRFLLEAVVPELVGVPLATAFVLVDLALIALDFWLVKAYRKRTWYRITPQALEYISGRSTIRYPWKDFTAAEYGRIRPGCICPVTFTVQGKEMILNQYTEHIFALALEILQHIRPYAPVEEELMRQVRGMADF